MRVLRILALIALLALTGCFRQADDSFDTVEPGGEAQVIPTATADSAVTIIAPDTDDQATPTQEADSPTEDAVPADTEADDPTATVRVIDPTATSTSTSLPPPTEEPADTLVPTATEPSIITPDTGPSQLQIETATPTPAPEQTAAVGPGLDATPTSVGDAPNECEHVVQAGENPFRIALNNGVSLEALLEANGLPPNPIIQPGQVLVIPGCVPEESEAPAPESTQDSTPAAEGDTVVHVVAAGETMLAIAQRYGVTVNAILEANNLTNPDQLSIGQELIIPQP